MEEGQIIMAINAVGGAFGSFESVKRQAEAIKKRVGAETESRLAEQEKTGLIKNEDGDMVEISSLTQEQVDELNRRAELNSISLRDAYILFEAADPHAEEIEENKKLAAKYEKLQNKMLKGEKLTPEEKSFLREHYPELAAKAERMEQEAEQLKKKLQGVKSKEDAQKIYLETKMNVMSELNDKDGSAIFILAAIDKAFDEHMGRGKSSKKLTDILA